MQGAPNPACTIEELSRAMRKNPTQAEKKLWQELRGKKLGFEFRQKFVIDSKYIEDFVCLEKRLIIECAEDNTQSPLSQHEGGLDFYLESRKFRILRFCNSEILGNLEGVLRVIKEALESSEDFDNAKYTCESTHAKAPPARMVLTDEQKRIVDLSKSMDKNEILAIQACAGSGKTSTLEEISLANPKQRFLYLAFNKSIATEAGERFPKNVEAKTIHSLAFNYAKMHLGSFALQSKISIFDLKELVEFDFDESYDFAYGLKIFENFLRSDKTFDSDLSGYKTSSTPPPLER